MKYPFFIIALCTFLLIQCTNNNNTHIISNGSIGSLTSKTPLNQIEGIFNNRYKTNKGLSVESTFKDLKKNYEISGIQTSIDAVVIFLKDSDVFVTIDKKELPENLRYNPNLTIEASQIPKEATFKYFMIAWED